MKEHRAGLGLRRPHGSVCVERAAWELKHVLVGACIDKFCHPPTDRCCATEGKLQPRYLICRASDFTDPRQNIYSWGLRKISSSGRTLKGRRLRRTKVIWGPELLAAAQAGTLRRNSIRNAARKAMNQRGETTPSRSMRGSTLLTNRSL